MENYLKILEVWAQLVLWIKDLQIDTFNQNKKIHQKYVPEGVEGFAKYKGKVDNIIFKLIGGLRSSMGYLGSRQIKYLRDKPQFVKITKAGFYESMVHNVDIVKSDNKY